MPKGFHVKFTDSDEKVPVGSPVVPSAKNVSSKADAATFAEDEDVDQNRRAKRHKTHHDGDEGNNDIKPTDLKDSVDTIQRTKHLKTTEPHDQASTSDTTLSKANSKYTTRKVHKPHVNPREAQHILKTRQNLPIWKKFPEIRSALRQHDCLLLVGQTGSGKSTQVPQVLYTEPWCKRQLVKVQRGSESTEIAVGGMIAVTEPRRIATQTLSRRVDHEMCLSPDNSQRNDPVRVGYAVRFASHMPHNTRIKFVTEGTLLQEMARDPALKQYSAVIVDEIHERSVDVDLLAGFLRNILHGDRSERGGVPLKVVVMSATLNMEELQTFFADPSKTRQDTIAHVESGTLPDGEDAKLPSPATSNMTKTDTTDTQAAGGVSVVHVEGRTYDVELYHELEPQHDYLDAMLKKILYVHKSEPMPGDILAFLTGQEDIQALQSQLEQQALQFTKDMPRIKVLPLYGSLPAHEQQEAFEMVKERNTRKIVLATNIAETSVTVLGVRYVIDGGKAKVKQYRSSLGMDSLLVQPISKVSAIQRRGRAGREGPGKCWRLYTEADYMKLAQAELPEILRTDIVEAVLKMKSRGIDDIFAFPFMDLPDGNAMRRALIQLTMLGALDDSGKITDEGLRMARFPLPAVFGKVLMAAALPQADCLMEAIDVIAVITSESEPFLQPRMDGEREEMEELRKELSRQQGDILTYLTTLRRFAAETTDPRQWCRKRFISFSAMKNALAIRKQLIRICCAQKLFGEEAPGDDADSADLTGTLAPERAEVLIKTFLKAFVAKTATLGPQGNYITTCGRHTIAIHPSSVLYGRKVEAIMFLDHVFTSKSYAKIVTAVQANWIAEAMFA